jgi:hypothetical protein
MAVNIDGNGLIALGGTSSTQGRLRLAEDTDNGTNYIELTAPASVGSDRTITFPDATTTVVGTDTTQTLTNKSIVATQLTGTIAAARLPSGSLLQVVSTTKTDTTSTSSSSYADMTGMSVSITPSSASNKVLIMFTACISNSNAGNNDEIQLVRGSTAIAINTSQADKSTVYNRIQTGGTTFITTSTMNFLDSPNTTSATTYKLQWKTTGGTLYLNRRGADDGNGTVSTITVMEIAG